MKEKKSHLIIVVFKTVKKYRVELSVFKDELDVDYIWGVVGGRPDRRKDT